MSTFKNTWSVYRYFINFNLTRSSGQWIWPDLIVLMGRHEHTLWWCSNSSIKISNCFNFSQSAKP